MLKPFSRHCLAVLFGLCFAGTALAAVDINTADEAALVSLKGLGPATAKRILEERTRRGAYKDGADLAERVSGIGPKSVVRLQEAGLTFGKAAPAAAKPAAKPAASAQPAKAASR
jgi:competence protein ComEA